MSGETALRDVSMRLLIVTQVVDSEDPTLGFFHHWLTEFGERCEWVTVICLKEGKCELPKNATVYSLGKKGSTSSPRPKGGLLEYRVLADGVGPCNTTFRDPDTLWLPRTPRHIITRLRYLSRFYATIWREREHYDVVFVHMNPEYVVLGAPLWRLMRKRVGLWYTHKSVTGWLRLATWFADIIFTASKESFRIQSSKVRIIGHGIDTRSFNPGSPTTERERRIVTVGRITRSKNIMGVIDVAKRVREQCPDVELCIVGSAVTDIDREYERGCRVYAKQQGFDLDRVFAGGVRHERVVEVLHQASVFVSMSETGSLDKAVLEAMACGVPVVTTNEAGKAVMREVCSECVPRVDGEVLGIVCDVLSWSMAERQKAGDELAAYVREHHGLSTLVGRIFEECGRL